MTQVARVTQVTQVTSLVTWGSLVTWVTLVSLVGLALCSLLDPGWGGAGKQGRRIGKPPQGIAQEK